MSENDHNRYRYSVTCQTDDLAIVHCLRALCQYAEEARYKQIGWGGTKTKEWRAAGNQITLRFTRSDYRARFEETAQRLLPQGSWSVVGRSDNDPAKRQRV